MQKYQLLVLFILLGIVLVGCGTSETAIQTAIAQTEIAKPTETQTPLPTETPTPTLTSVPTSIPTETPTETPTPRPLAERIIGKWSGAMTNKDNDKMPATMTILDGGSMVFEIALFNVSYGAQWTLDGNRLNIISELDPENPTYRDLEFVSDDVVIMTKDEAGVRETWTRVKE